MSREERLEHVDLLTDLLEKQQVMYTRLSLSDDPQAGRNEREPSQISGNDGIPTRD